MVGNDPLSYSISKTVSGTGGGARCEPSSSLIQPTCFLCPVDFKQEHGDTCLASVSEHGTSGVLTAISEHDVSLILAHLEFWVPG